MGRPKIEDDTPRRGRPPGAKNKAQLEPKASPQHRQPRQAKGGDYSGIISALDRLSGTIQAAAFEIHHAIDSVGAEPHTRAAHTNGAHNGPEASKPEEARTQAQPHPSEEVPRALDA